MRLICPNCGAQYEVSVDAIPEQGRDVQCSNCAHTWFETPGASEARERGEDVPTDPPSPPAEPPAPEPEPAPEPQQDSEPEAAPEVAESPAESEAEPAQDEASDDAAADADDGLDDDDFEDDFDDVTEEDDGPAPAASPATSGSVADILREEAAREEAKRAEEAEAQLQSQPDLGLDGPVDRDEQLAEEARRRMARLRGEAAPAIGAATAAGASARGELLPDVDEIKSSLRSDQGDVSLQDDDPDAAPRGRSGFRRGFMTVIIVALLLLALYILAPRLSMMVPALEPILERYVSGVDSLRLWLDLTLQGLMSGDSNS